MLAFGDTKSYFSRNYEAHIIYEWILHCLPNAKQIPFIGSLTAERVFRVIFSEMLFLTDTQITSGTRYTLKKMIAKTIPPTTIIKVLAGANSVYMVR